MLIKEHSAEIFFPLLLIPLDEMEIYFNAEVNFRKNLLAGEEDFIQVWGGQERTIKVLSFLPWSTFQQCGREDKIFLGFINSSHGLWSNWEVRAVGRGANSNICSFQEENQLKNSTEWNLKEFLNLLKKKQEKLLLQGKRDITRKVSAKYFFKEYTHIFAIKDYLLCMSHLFQHSKVSVLHCNLITILLCYTMKKGGEKKRQTFCSDKGRKRLSPGKKSQHERFISKESYLKQQNRNSPIN